MRVEFSRVSELKLAFRSEDPGLEQWVKNSSGKDIEEFLSPRKYVIDETLLLDDSVSLKVVPDRNVLELLRDVAVDDFDEDSLDIVSELGQEIRKLYEELKENKSYHKYRLTLNQLENE